MGEKGGATEKYHASAQWKLHFGSLSNSEGTFVTLLCVFGVLSPAINFVCMSANIIRRIQMQMTHAGHEKQRFPLQRDESFLRTRDNI